MTNETHPIGSLVLSINGEMDSDDRGAERKTGPRAWGHIADYAPECGYSVHFAKGVTVFIDHGELADVKAYEVVSPGVMAQRMRELSEWDSEMNNVSQRAPTGGDYETALSIVGITA